jgi:hypothetical protein
MWAKVDDSNNITEIIAHPKTMIVDGITHPRTLFSVWTDAEKRAIGIYEIQRATGVDENYYIANAPTYAVSGTKVVETITKSGDRNLADINEVWTQSEIDDGQAPSGIKANDPKLDDDGNQLVTKGLKTNAKNKATTQANGLLQGFNWLIQRKVTADTAIPSDVVTYMAAIRTDHKAICDAIDGASDMDAFIALHNDTYKEDGTVDVVARVNRWTDDKDVKQHRR